mgnify:FL=1
MGKTSRRKRKSDGGTIMRFCLNPVVLLAVILLAWPELVFGAEAVKTVKIGPDFGPLVDAARIAGCCSVLVAMIWGTSLVIAARTRKRGGDPKCGE